MQTVKESFSFRNPIFRYNADIFTVCLALSAAGIYHWGIYALWQLLICSLTAVISEAVAFRAVLKKNTAGDLSALTTGMIIALLLPVSAPFYVGISASAFAILVAKLPFGDVRNTPFLPSAAGFCFAAMMFTDAVFTYPAAGSEFAFFGSEAFVKGATLFDMLSKGNSLSLNVFGRVSLLSGDYPGAIGTTSMLLLLGGFGYMAVRHPKRLFASAGYILAAAVFAFLFPRVNSGRLSSVISELCAGGLIFTALLLITDPVCSPRKPDRAFFYGLMGGTVCMLLRYFSKTPDAACFSILITNALWPALTGETILSKKTAEKYKKPLMKKRDALKRKAGAE
ncbi:MAG: RnfABCDGE type electron transport complex subunit D [Clostridia bacterium]|nr:RnfABCDGE type electron transport complex subunit D [Clostridia bacterium]